MHVPRSPNCENPINHDCLFRCHSSTYQPYSRELASASSGPADGCWDCGLCVTLRTSQWVTEGVRNVKSLHTLCPPLLSSCLLPQKEGFPHQGSVSSLRLFLVASCPLEMGSVLSYNWSIPAFFSSPLPHCLPHCFAPPLHTLPRTLPCRGGHCPLARRAGRVTLSSLSLSTQIVR